MNTLAVWTAEQINTLVLSLTGLVVAVTALWRVSKAASDATAARATTVSLQESLTRVSTRQNAADDRAMDLATKMPPPPAPAPPASMGTPDA